MKNVWDKAASHRVCNYRRALLLSVSLLATNTIVLSEETAARPGDELLVVDCRLPPVVRRLGKQTTYLSARKAIRTTARDCQIRGGEYVAYDRASLKSSLEVWLPQAETGDDEAQTIVGEIYEKGIDGQPDYAKAARWYRTAAAQGNVRAQISLGYLYENGLGVERNDAEAASWYKRAADTDYPIELEPRVSPVDRLVDRESSAELESLQAEILALNADTERMRSQLQDTRISLSVARTKLSTSEAERLELERELQQETAARQAMAAAPKIDKEAAISPTLLIVRNELEQSKQEIAELTSLLEFTQSALADRGTEIESLDAQVDRQSAALREAEQYRQQLLQLNSKLAESQEQIALQRQDIARLEATMASNQSSGADELEELRATLSATETAEKGLQTEVAQLETRLETSQRVAAAANTSRAQLETDLRTRENELAAERKKATSLQARLDQLSAQTANLEKDLSQKRMATAVQSRILAGPTIALIEPELSGTRGITLVSDSKNLVAAVRPETLTRQLVGRVTAPAGLLTLTVNDASVEPNPAGVFVADLKLDNLPKSVSIVAIDQQGKKGNVAFDLRAISDQSAGVDTGSDYSTRLRQIGFGNYYALIIGNNDYSGMPDLKTPIQDARELNRVLSEKYMFKTKLLLNASRYDILSALNELRETLTSDDNLLIFYAGHGELDRKNMRGHWLPVDAEPGSSANWLSNIAITDILNVMNARQVMVVADSCYSGALTRSSIAKLTGGMTEQERLNWLKTMAEKRSRMVLSSGGLAPVLDAGGGEHSVFARALLDALENNDELIEGQRLYQEVAARVAYQAANMQFDQVPEYAPIRFAGHESGDFFFIPERL